MGMEGVFFLSLFASQSKTFSCSILNVFSEQYMLCIDMGMKNNKLYWGKGKKPQTFKKVDDTPFSRNFPF